MKIECELFGIAWFCVSGANGVVRRVVGRPVAEACTSVTGLAGSETS